MSYDYSTFCHIYETFFKESYKLLEVKDKVVLDIGASLGDTSIYFAMKGAKKVYAYEPLKEIFKYLLLNIKINNYDEIIIPAHLVSTGYEIEINPPDQVTPAGRAGFELQSITIVIKNNDKTILSMSSYRVGLAL